MRMILLCLPPLLRKLLSICDEYGKEFSIKFNASKSKWLAVVTWKRRWLLSELDFCQFQMGGYHVDRVSSFVYLGHTITSEIPDKDDNGIGAVLLLDR